MVTALRTKEGGASELLYVPCLSRLFLGFMQPCALIVVCCGCVLLVLAVGGCCVLCTIVVA
jgi:hypothetical protein